MPPAFEEHSLIASIRLFCDNISAGNRLVIDIETNEEELQLDMNLNVTLFRIIQELLQNIIKHAAATHIVISIEAQDTQLALTVEDNGKGFVPDSGKSDGIGIANLKRRVAEINGSINFDSIPGEGTTVTVLLGIDKTRFFVKNSGLSI